MAEGEGDESSMSKVFDVLYKRAEQDDRGMTGW